MSKKLTVSDRLDLIEATLAEKKKKDTKLWPYMTYTTGDIGLNIKRFNQAMGTDYNNPSTEEAKAQQAADNAASDLAGSDTASGEAGAISGEGSVGEASGESAGGEGGAMGESLKVLDEAKREVRRYYLKPQELFCANKAEVIHALITIGNEDCVVYTLINLGDNKDVTKLTTHDIIYFYKDGILYDKNHIKVMDYDLYIKHEEERTKFASVDTISASTFKDEYDDRITDVTGPEITESILESKPGLAELRKKLDAGEEVELGDGDVPISGSYGGFSDGGYYSNTEYTARKDGDSYILSGIDMSESGDNGDAEAEDFSSFDNLVDEIISKVTYSVYDLEGALEEDIFNQNFDSINAYGKKLTEGKDEEHTCVICGEEFTGYGNNPDPIKEDGVCCDACNEKFVIPARLDQINAATDGK